MDDTATATFLFTDIEASTRLWEREPERMRPAMARHDALAREVVRAHGGHFVKKTGDGLHAAFADALDAVLAAVDLQLGLARIEEECGLPLRARCGMHAGAFERRDDDYYGTAVNRAARIMAAAHGGQVLVSGAIAQPLEPRLPRAIALRDLGAARLRDLSRPERIYQVVHESLRADFPALRSLEVTPNNLPHIPSSFIGRERELAEARALLARTRLLTLTGMGGLGKTRLALQIAAEATEDFPDGVWLVELAPLRDPRRVEHAVASVMAVKEEPGHSLVEALERHVHDRRLLLVLDSCEHLLGECAVLVRRLLAASEHVRILASTREPLRVAGEAIHAVPSLEVPDSSVTDARSLLGYASARLFLERASAARSDFSVDAASANAIADICRRLDGIPLALELAAARVRTLSAQSIAARLDDRFRLLASGDRSAMPRQQTLRAMIDWSHDLLSEPERALLRRLSVFSGGWTLAAAEAVGSTPALAAPDVLDVLGRLVEKSLVEHDAQAERYRFLETVREYAADRLEESGERDAARRRHFACFAALAAQARPALFGPEQAHWLARLDLERENLIAAHEAAMQGMASAAEALAMLGSLKAYWVNRGLLEVGVGMYQEALAQPACGSRDATRCRAMFELGQLRFYMGDHGRARASLEEALGIARELRDEDMVAALLPPLGGVALGQGELAEARAYLEEAIELGTQRAEPRYLAAARNGLAQLFRVEGRPELAEPILREVLAGARETGDRESVAIALLNLAMVAAQPDPIAARAMLMETIGIAEELRSRPVTQSILEACAGLAAATGEWKEAARFFGAAEAQGRKTGLRRDAADEAFLAPLVERARRSLGTEAFAEAQAAGEALHHGAAIEAARAWLGSPVNRAAASAPAAFS